MSGGAARRAGEPPAMSEAARRVLDAVDEVPIGSATTYGEIARRAGTTARLVGHVLARYGHEVPWHRVVRADGTPPRHLAAEQLARLAREAVPLVSGRRVDLRAVHRRTAELEGPSRGGPGPS